MKKLFLIFPLALIICFIVGCQDKEAMAELDAMKAQAALEEQNKATVGRLIEELNKGNAEILEELYAPDYVCYSPSGTTKSMSREEVIEMMKMVFRTFSDINWSIEELIAVGDRVIFRFIMRGTHEGEFRGISATGNKIESSGIIIHHIVNGKIVEMREEFDTLGLYQQLGMELKPKEGKN